MLHLKYDMRKDIDKTVRRIDRQMNEAEALELLKNCEYGILSTCGEGNKPYGIPLNYVVIEKNIYFHCASEI